MTRFNDERNFECTNVATLPCLPYHRPYTMTQGAQYIFVRYVFDHDLMRKQVTKASWK